MTSLTPELLAAFCLFAFVSSITPGPNNTMLLASGVNFGLKRTIPHLMGVSLGFLVLLLAVGLGLGAVFAAYPTVHGVVKWTGGAYLVYLAIKIATAKGVAGASATGQPVTFLQAVAFQWVNPKALAMAMGAAATYAPSEHYTANLVVIALIFAAINLPCVAGWAGLGMALRRFLDRPGVLKVFNLVMAGLLLLSLYPLAAELVTGASAH